MNFLKKIFKEKKQEPIINTKNLEPILQESHPYSIKIENSSEEEKLVNVFGFNHYWNEKNFGNDECIKITSLQGENTNYSHLFASSATKPFDIF